MATPIVFVSHSHHDRAIAVELESLLKENGAETFLDQSKVEVGDDLPSGLRDGVERCSVFLLIWSRSASVSSWVNREWNLAYDYRKRIIPMRLDETPLPSPLDGLLHVASNDRSLAYSNLLTAVFGRTFEPPVGEIFAGKWRADFDAFGMANGTAMLELRRNGQIVGAMRIGAGGVLGSGLAELGMANLLNTEFPLTGQWTYERGTRQLEMHTEASGFGQQGSDTIRIMATGRETGPIQGQDLQGRTWVLTRVGGSA